jgi:hypothetical protein
MTANKLATRELLENVLPLHLALVKVDVHSIGLRIQVHTLLLSIGILVT